MKAILPIAIVLSLLAGIAHADGPLNPGGGGSSIPTPVSTTNGGTGVAGSLTGARKANGASPDTQAACADLSNGSTGCSAATGTSGHTLPFLDGANTFSGGQTFSGGLLPTSSTATRPTVDSSGSSGYSIGNGANAAISNSSTGSFVFFVSENSCAGGTAIYSANGGSAFLMTGGAAGWVAPTTSPAAGKFAVGWDSGSNLYRIYNNQGGTCTFSVMSLRFG